MESYATKIKDVISLAQGTPSFFSDPIIRKEVIYLLLSNRVDQYSTVAGLFSLRKNISKLLEKRNMFYDSEDEIVITAGSMEGLSCTMLGLVKPGDEVIIPTPTYVAYERIVRMISAKPVFVRLEENNNWQLDIKKFEQHLTLKTKAIILCNPNNPTGSIYQEKVVYQLASLAKKNNMYLILDEVYDHFRFENKKSNHPCEEKKFKKNIIRIYSFSKDYALTGWRIGYLHSDESIIQKIIGPHENLINCAPVISQYAALAALKHPEIIDKNLLEYKKRRNIMGTALSKLKNFLSFSWPTGSYYFFPRIKGLKNSKKFCLDLLDKVELSVVPGIGFGMGGEGHIRLCFGKSEKEVDIGMKRLAEYFNKFYLNHH